MGLKKNKQGSRKPKINRIITSLCGPVGTGFIFATTIVCLGSFMVILAAVVLSCCEAFCTSEEFSSFQACLPFSLNWGIIDPIKESNVNSITFLVICVVCLLALLIHLGIRFIKRYYGSFDLYGVVGRRKSSPYIENGVYAPELKKMKDEDHLATFFLTAAITPKNIFSAIDEKIYPCTRSLMVNTFASIKVPYTLQGDAFILPLFFCRRGDYPDSLVIKNATGGTVSYLNYEESVNYTILVFKSFLPKLKEKSSEDLVEKIRLYLSAVGTIPLEEDERIEEAKKLASDLHVLISNESDKRLRIRVRVLSQYLYLTAMKYPICIRCIPDHDFKNDEPITKDTPLKYQAQAARTMGIYYVRRLSLIERNAKKCSCLNSIRSFFAKPMKTIYFGLENADRTESYHLQTSGPEDTYFTYAVFQRIPGSFSSPTAEVAGAQCRCGQRHSRFVIKNGDDFSGWTLGYRFMPRKIGLINFAAIAFAIEALASWLLLCSLLPMLTMNTGEAYSLCDFEVLCDLLSRFLQQDSTSIPMDVLSPLLFGLVTLILTWMAANSRKNAAEADQIAPAIWLAGIIMALISIVGSFCFERNPSIGVSLSFFSVLISAAFTFWFAREIIFRSVMYWGFGRRKKYISDLLVDNDDQTRLHAASSRRWKKGVQGMDAHSEPETYAEFCARHDVRYSQTKDKNYIRNSYIFSNTKKKPSQARLALEKLANSNYSFDSNDKVFVVVVCDKVCSQKIKKSGLYNAAVNRSELDVSINAYNKSGSNKRILIVDNGIRQKFDPSTGTVEEMINADKFPAQWTLFRTGKELCMEDICAILEEKLGANNFECINSKSVHWSSIFSNSGNQNPSNSQNQ